MELIIKTTKTFNDINSNNKIVMLRGGSRSGKSYSAVQWLIVKALETPNLVISIVRKSLPSLKKSIFRDFKSIMNNLNIWEEDRFMTTDMIYTFENGSILEFFSIMDAEKRKGTKRNYLFVDEANEITYEDFFQLFIRTTDKTILAFNPSFSKHHWLYDKVLPHPNCIEFVSTYKDNPFLEQSIADEIEMLKLTSPSYYKVYGEGGFGMIEGLVFDNFNTIDTLPPLEEMELLSYGMDFGFSNDPTTLIACFKHNDNIILHELLYKKGLLTSEISKNILSAYETYGKKYVIADSSDPRLIQEISRYNGMLIKGADKGKDSIRLGIDIMLQNKILITKQSNNLLNEMYNYSWKKDKDGNSLGIPDGEDHGIDATRYSMMYSLSSKKINTGKYIISVR